MPHARNRNPSPIPEVTWDTGLKEMNETWKGAIACLGVAVFFVMTIGIIYWQVVDQPNKNWILRGTFSGLIWERRTHSLVIQTLTEDRTYAEIDVGNVGNPDMEVPFVRNMCWLNKTEFCYTWDSVAEVKISLEVDEDSEKECYSMSWTPVHCYVELKDCFSMANISWYGGASVRGQTWPINDQNITMQPYIVSDLKDTPSGYGSPLECYFLGSSVQQNRAVQIRSSLPGGKPPPCNAAGSQRPRLYDLGFPSTKPTQIQCTFIIPLLSINILLLIISLLSCFLLWVRAKN